MNDEVVNNSTIAHYKSKDNTLRYVLIFVVLFLCFCVFGCLLGAFLFISSIRSVYSSAFKEVKNIICDIQPNSYSSIQEFYQNRLTDEFKQNSSFSVFENYVNNFRFIFENCSILDQFESDLFNILKGVSVSFEFNDQYSEYIVKYPYQEDYMVLVLLRKNVGSDEYKLHSIQVLKKQITTN